MAKPTDQPSTPTSQWWCFVRYLLPKVRGIRRKRNPPLGPFHSDDTARSDPLLSRGARRREKMDILYRNWTLPNRYSTSRLDRLLPRLINLLAKKPYLIYSSFPLFIPEGLQSTIRMLYYCHLMHISLWKIARKCLLKFVIAQVWRCNLATFLSKSSFESSSIRII